VVGSPHEALHQIFRADDTLILSAIQRVLGVQVHDSKRADELPGDVTTLPLEGRVDSVLLVELDGASCVLAVEAQTEPDDDKETRWPYYLAYLHAKYCRPAAIIVVTSIVRTARWARQPIKIDFPGLGPTMIVQPIVFGPDNVPLVVDLADARANVGFAVFSLLVHGRSAQAHEILETLAEALASVEIATATQYVELTDAGLVNSTARKRWKELMATQTFPYQSSLKADWMAEGRAEGRAEGEAKVILRVLEARGITLSAQGRQRIISCTDEEQLLAWGTRAATTTSEEDLFA
jgi:hypothetical protein